MGRYKHMMMEMEDQGYDLSGKMVSPDCFDDVNLRKRLSKFGIDGICTYSHQKGIVVPMEDAVGFINKYLLRYYDDPGQCDLYLASSFLDKGEEKDKDSLLDFINQWNSQVHFTLTRMAYDEQKNQIDIVMTGLFGEDGNTRTIIDVIGGLCKAIAALFTTFR